MQKSNLRGLDTCLCFFATFKKKTAYETLCLLPQMRKTLPYMVLIRRGNIGILGIIFLFAFVDLEKAFDLVPWKVIWWALRKLGVDEWIVPLVQGMYFNARSHVCVGEGYSEEFEVKVGVHQGSVLSPLLFIIVLEALSCEFRCGVPREVLYADDLVIIAELIEECVRRLLTWKGAMEEKGLRINAGKTKIMICGTGLDLLQSSGKFP